MSRELDQVAEPFALVATASSKQWDVTIDEALDREEWSMEIEGPQTYLSFQLRDLSVVREALRFLQIGLKRNGARDRDEESLTLGRFGSASVSLIWDNEDFPRCFVAIGLKSRSTVRVSLQATDIEMLIEALSQVTKELPLPGG